MTRIGSAVFIAAVVLLQGAPSLQAATATRIKYVAVDPKPGTIRVAVSDHVTTAIQPLDAIRDWILGDGQHYTVTRSPNDPRVISVQPVVANPQFTTLRILSGGDWYTLELHIAKGEKPVSDVIFVPTEADIPDPDNAIIVDYPSIHSPVQAHLALVADETEATAPASVSWSEGPHKIQLSISSMRWSHDKHENLTFRFELHNFGSYPYPISALAMHDIVGREYETAIHPLKLAAGDYLLEPGASLVGALRVSKATALRSGWEMHLSATPGVPAARMRWEGGARWPKRGPIEDRLVVSVHAAGGAINLDDGVGLDLKAWTTSQVLGVRVLYGAMKHVSIEGTLAVARTSSAMFENASWGSDQGTLEVDETSGRVSIGGLLHTAGKRWIPYARVALGARVSRHSTTMGARSEAETRLATILGFGGGLNVRIGGRMMAGASVAVINGLGDGAAQTFEAGVHLGASWDFGNGWD